MQRITSSRQERSAIIGKTIAGVIARPGEDGEILMLQFDDGTCFELVSAQSRKALTGLARRRGNERQLTIFSPDGISTPDERRPSLAA